MQNYKFFDKEETYFVRIYKESGKIRFQALNKPPADAERYEMRDCLIYSGISGNRRKIQFYLDNVWIKPNIIHDIASRITNTMRWD